MTKILWLSYCAPYASVPHAGGKNHFYWLNKIHEDPEFDITLVTCCKDSRELISVENMHYDFDVWCSVGETEGFGKWKQKVLTWVLAPYSICKFAGSISMYKILFIKSKVKELQKSGYVPDTIILQWTQVGFLFDWIKKVFPTSNLVIIEEDVSFLRTEREKNQQTGAGKLVKSIIHHIMKKRELTMCHMANGVVVNNQKDKKILINNGIDADKVINVVPYYQQMFGLKRAKESKNILFYGAMGRTENSTAAAWFAKTVMPELYKKTGVTFTVLGGNPPQEILDLKNEYTVVTGFVEDIKVYFADCFCMIAPLFSGAGIKIKVLEGMSAGVPILTNHIGIEGISAEDGVEYCHCETKEDYIQWINTLLQNGNLAGEIGIKGQRFVKENFDPRTSEQDFKQLIIGR